MFPAAMPPRLGGRGERRSRVSPTPRSGRRSSAGRAVGLPFLGTSTSTWTGDDGAGLRHEADHLVEVDGDLGNPDLEWSKHSAFGWFGPGDLERLKENRAPGEFLIHDLIARAVRDAPDRTRGA